MAQDTFQCTVVTPEGEIYDGLVTFAVIPAHDGEIGILPGRAPLLCKLGAGEMRLHTDGEQESWFVDGGFAEVAYHELTVLTQKGIRAEEIQREQAESLLSEAKSMRVTDEISARRKAEATASARAQLRLARG